MLGKNKDEKFLDHFIENDGYGYGDPEARLNDDRKILLLLNKQHGKTQKRLYWLTFISVVATIVNTVNALTPLFVRH